MPPTAKAPTPAAAVSRILRRLQLDDDVFGRVWHGPEALLAQVLSGI